MSSPRIEPLAALVSAVPPIYIRGEAGPFCSAHRLGWHVAVTSLPCSVLSQLESSPLLCSHLPSCRCSNAGLLWIHSLHWQEEVCISQTGSFMDPLTPSTVTSSIFVASSMPATEQAVQSRSGERVKSPEKSFTLHFPCM